MRIFCFNYPRGKQYIDLDHVQQVSHLSYNAVRAGTTKDKDGIDMPHKSHGSAKFWIYFAFQAEPREFQLVYDSSRYEYPDLITWQKDPAALAEVGVTGPYAPVDAFIELERFRLEYERMMGAWCNSDETLREWSPPVYNLAAG